MRVLHVVGAYPIPPLGGIETVVVELTGALAGLGVENQVVAAASGPRSDVRSGVAYFGLPVGFVSNWIQVPRVGTFRELQRHLDWAEIVHVHNPTETFNLLAIEMARRRRLPVVLSLLAPGQLPHHPKLFYRWLGRVGERFLEREVAYAAAVQVKNSIDLAFAERYGRHPILIPDGVADSILTAPSGAAGAPGPLAEVRGHPIVLFLGRLHPLKGPEDVVAALPSLVRRYPDVQVLMAGADSGGMAARISRRAASLGVADHLHLLGPVNESEKLALLDRADVVALPSRADFVEGFSIVASEAWARGRPVAAYPVGALRARVHDGENGYLATAASSDALAEAIVRAIDLGRVRPGADVVSWKAVAERFDAIYLEIARDPSAATRGSRAS